MSKRSNEYQITDADVDREEEAVEAGSFEKASEEEIKSRKKIVAKKKNPSQPSSSPSPSLAGGFNFVLPQTNSAGLTTTPTEPPKMAWSFGNTSSTPSTGGFVFGVPPTDPKDNIIKELEKRVKDLEKETEQLKKQVQEKSSAPTTTGGFAFSFNQPKTTTPISFPSTPAAATITTPVVETKPVTIPAAVVVPQEKKEEEKKPEPKVEEKKEEEKKPLFNFNFGGSSSTVSESGKFGGFSTFSSPFGSSSGESQFKFEVSNMPPTWNQDYKPKESEGGEEDGSEDPSIPESPSRATSHKIIDLPAVEVKSGEEGETVLGEFKLAKLYRTVIVDGKSSWQQRGVGSLRLNISKNDEKNARMVMRTDSVFKLILNCKVIKGMKFTPLQEQSIIFPVHKSQLCEQLSAEELAKEPEFVSHLIRFDQKNDRPQFNQKIESILSKL